MLFLFEVCKKFESEGLPYAIVGGYAVALHGFVRGTADIDIALLWSRANLEKAERLLGELGLTSRLPITADDLYHFREEYIRNRNLIAWNFYDPHNGSKQVDLIVAYDLKGAKTVKIETPAGSVRVLSKRDLIAMKRASGRAQDLEDIKALEAE